MTAVAEPSPKPYGRVVTADAKTRNGLFKVHRINNRLLFEIPHRPIRYSEQRVERLRRRYIAHLEQHNGRKPLYYDRSAWTRLPGEYRTR